ncbi:ABC transporter permease [Candidatus Xianfuyuplasma coldseepsis]|uniref:ABC transporter permease n=1 Tax=Candidatus Xianfuyuplasma coldseepsis TaxID=2782163 RepID=A0A7L7KQQ7_9MOLU|nr:ABC transporter permease [Xianfuyuplasma coldseepsis]QMS84556.1 ABC transporter permease [Xianfuyuplasma coldseepsis]
MTILWQLVIRNLKLYLRDRAAVFFSFLSVIIILAMYILFLGKMQVDNLSSAYDGIDGIDWLVATWIMAGIVTVSCVTVPLGALGKLIDDRADNIINDFYTSPINRNTLALSYLMSAWVIGFIMVMLNFVIGQVYVLSQGGEFLSLLQYAQMLGLMMLIIMTFSIFFFYLSLFIRTQNAWGLLNTLIGTFIGFLGGIYIPIGVLGDNVATVMNLLPTAHAVTIVRQVYMAKAIDFVFDGVPIEHYNNYAQLYGVSITINGYEMQNWQMIVSLIVFMVIFYVLTILKLRNTKL